MTEAGEFWDQRFAERAWPTDPDALLVAEAQDIAPGRALDVGSGPGRNSLWLAARGWTVEAVDASAVGLQQAQDHARDAGLQLTTRQVDVLTWRPAESSYELVVLANLHLPPAELADLLQRLTKALVAGGHLFVVGHDLANLGRHGPSDPALLLTVDRLAGALPTELVVERLERISRNRDDVAVVLWGSRQAGRNDPSR